MINLVEICRLKYPGQIEAGNITFRQPDNDILIGTWDVQGIAQPSEADLLAEASQYDPQFQLNTFLALGQSLIGQKSDSVAQERQYNDAVSCASYVMSTNPQWKSESETFIAWRDALYAYGLSVFAAIQAGGLAPSEEEFIAGFPVITWP